MIEQIRKDLKEIANPEKAQILERFFKTGEGEYGEGQKFLGGDTNSKRLIAKKYLTLNFEEIEKLLTSVFHDERFVAMTILEHNYKKKNSQKKIVDFYIKNAKKFNNWDLVDLSAYKILGDWLKDKDKKVLYKFAISNNLWERRIAIISTYAFIRVDEFEDTFKIAEILLNDKEDLIHKAVGWMLREVGKRDLSAEENFLKKHYKKMPRTMLRYSIEKFPEEKRQKYLKGFI